MSSTLIPWRSCSVEIYRYRQIGILWYSRHSHERDFVNAIDFVRRSGVGYDSDGFRFVYTDGGGRIDISEVDWTGLDECCRQCETAGRVAEQARRMAS